MAESIDSTLAQRGSRYGIFAVHAEHTQALKKLLRQLMGEGKWNALHQDQQEALEMIAHKLGRITNGDPNYDDSWRDIAGYAQLVANRLAGQAEPTMKAEVMQASMTAADAIGELAAKAMEACRPTFKVGDRVRITGDVKKAAVICDRDKAGWVPAMAKQLDQLGTVVEVSEHNTARVLVVGAQSYWWSAECLEHAPAERGSGTETEGTAVHMILLDESDPEVEAIQRMLVGFLRGR